MFCVAAGGEYFFLTHYGQKGFTDKDCAVTLRRASPAECHEECYQMLKECREQNKNKD